MRRVMWNYVNAALMVGITVVLAFITASWLRRHVSPVAPSWASTDTQSSLLDRARRRLMGQAGPNMWAARNSGSRGKARVCGCDVR
jgi:hypothetical protein